MLYKDTGDCTTTSLGTAFDHSDRAKFATYCTPRSYPLCRDVMQVVRRRSRGRKYDPNPLDALIETRSRWPIRGEAEPEESRGKILPSEVLRCPCP